MNALLRAVVSVALFAILSACGSLTPRIEISAATLSDVRTVAVVSPREPMTYQLINFYHPAMAIPVIGVEVARADLAAKGGQLSGEFRARMWEMEGHPSVYDVLQFRGTNVRYKGQRSRAL
ncbi:MAG: hypothetical protein ACKVQU_31440 [Burkholderiales bacterium]